jgi:hypothetical protein
MQGGGEVGSSERVVRIFAIEITLGQTLGNWHHFIMSIRRIENLLTVKELLNAVSYFGVILLLSGLWIPLLGRMLFMG